MAWVVRIHTVSGDVVRMEKDIPALAEWLNRRYETSVKMESIDDVARFLGKIQPYDVEIDEVE